MWNATARKNWLQFHRSIQLNVWNDLCHEQLKRMPNTGRPSEPIRPTDSARLDLLHLDPELALVNVFRRACEISSRAIDVERVGVWLFVEDRSALRCASLYERSKNEHSEGIVIRVADFPTYFAAIKVRKSVPAEVASTDPRTAQLYSSYLQPLGISSMLDAGIFLENQLVGVVCHEHVGPPREWSTEQRDFAGSVADLLALRMAAARLDELRSVSRSQLERVADLEKAEALAHLASGVAHDFRNLLAIVSGHADLLLHRRDMPAGATDSIKEILSAVGRGDDLTRELLDFAKPNGKPPVTMNLVDSVTSFFEALRAAVGSRHVVTFRRPPAVGQVMINRNDFSRILLNLVLNARDSMPEGGEIEVSIRPVKASESSGHSSHFVLLEIADQGCGMDSDTVRRAFDPFFTTKAKGTGLGLAIVRRLVDRAGGFVRIESTPGHGTVVRCFFPRVGASSGGTAEMPSLRL